jgi:PadR family transcriptional regulator PadR
MDNAQLLKGILEGCVLSIISNGETYGYDILTVLERHGFADIHEGTLYPVLVRLEKKNDIVCRIGKSPFGPRRKYYSITDEGRYDLERFLSSYHNLTKCVNNIISDIKTDEQTP